MHILACICLRAKLAASHQGSLKIVDWDWSEPSLSHIMHRRYADFASGSQLHCSCISPDLLCVHVQCTVHEHQHQRMISRTFRRIAPVCRQSQQWSKATSTPNSAARGPLPRPSEEKASEDLQHNLKLDARLYRCESVPSGMSIFLAVMALATPWRLSNGLSHFWEDVGEVMAVRHSVSFKLLSMHGIKALELSSELGIVSKLPAPCLEMAILMNISWLKAGYMMLLFITGFVSQLQRQGHVMDSASCAYQVDCKGLALPNVFCTELVNRNHAV